MAQTMSTGLAAPMAQRAFEDGLAQLEVELQRLALDAQAATVRGVPLADAVLDFENFHQLARLDAAVDDILTMSLPAELEAWVRRLLASPEPPSFEAMQTALVAAAADPTKPLQQALARFFLFEGGRLQLVVMVKWFPTETIGVGLDLAATAFTRLDECGGAIPDDNQGDAAFVDDFERLVDRIEERGESEFTRFAARSLREYIANAREPADEDDTVN